MDVMKLSARLVPGSMRASCRKEPGARVKSAVRAVLRRFVPCEPTTEKLY
jgi:hypothetical protein